MQVGGAETIIAQLCRIQRDQGHRPCVYCLYEIGRVGQRLQNESFEVTLERPPTLFGLMRSLYRTFKRSKPDVVHCHNATAAIAGAVPARLAGVRSVLVTRHGLVGPPFSLRRELKFAVASRFCDWVVAVCDIARDNLRKAPFSTCRSSCARRSRPRSSLASVPRSESRRREKKCPTVCRGRWRTRPHRSPAP